MNRHKAKVVPCPRCHGTGRLPMPPTLGERIKLLREIKMLTLRDVEIRSKGRIANSTLSQIELGKIADISGERLKALAEVFEVSIDYLVGLEQPG